MYRKNDKQKAHFCAFYVLFFLFPSSSKQKQQEQKQQQQSAADSDYHRYKRLTRFIRFRFIRSLSQERFSIYVCLFLAFWIIMKVVNKGEQS